MAIFSGIAAAFATFTAWTATLSAVSLFALQTAASMGLSFLAQKLSGKKGPQKQPFGVKGQLERGADVPQAFILGNYATAGSLTYANTSSSPNTPNARMHWVITVSDLPVSGLTGLWVNGEKRDILPTDGEGWQNIDGFKDGGEYLRLRYYDGTQTAADTILVGEVSSSERPWSPSAVGHGKAYVLVRASIHETFFSNGFPTFLFEVEGIPLYDISKDSSVGGTGTHRWADPATWESSANPAVQLYNILRGIYYDGEWVYGLQDVAEAQLPVAHWIAQINKCAATIAGADGPEPLYRSSAEIPVDAEVHSVIESLLDACSGRLSDAGGVYKLFAGAPGAPVMSFTDADILSTSEQTFTPFLGLSDTVNGVVAKYPSPAAGWQVETAPPLYRPDYEAEDGGRRLLVDVSLDFVPYAEQAQRLMQSALNEARRARRHTLTLPPEYWPLEPGDVIAWTSERNGYEAKQFRVDGVVDMPNADVMLDLTEVDPADYAWDTNTDFTPPAVPSVIAQPIPPQEILAFAVQASSVKDAASDARRPAIRAMWDGDVSDVTAVKLQYRVKALGIEPHEARSDNVEAGQLYISSGVLPDTLYEVRAKFIPASPRETLWTEWLEVTTLNILVEEKDISQIVRDKITAAKDTADDAVQDAAEAKNTADDVRQAHDALVQGFVGSLVDGFAGVDQTIDDEIAATRTYADSGDQGIQTQVDLLSLQVSNSSYIRKTDGDDFSRGGWTALTGAAPVSGGTATPPGTTGRNIQVFPSGALELPYYSGRSVKDTVFRLRGWVSVTSGETGRVAIVGSLAGEGPGGETVLAQSEPITGGWQQVDLQFTVDVDTDEWAPAFLVTGGDLRFWRVRLEDYSAAADLEASIQQNYTLIQTESDARVLADTQIKAAYESADISNLATIRGETYTRAAVDGVVAASTQSLKSEMEGVGGTVKAAQDAAQAASDLAGSKGKVIVQNSAPSGANRAAENLWINTTSGKNQPNRWNTSTNKWEPVSDKIAMDAAAAAAAAQQAANNLDGEITDIKGLNLAGDTAFGTLLTQLDVSAGGTSAYLTQQGAAVSDLQGNASASYVFRAAAGGSSAGMELIAWDNATGGGSVIKLDAEDIIATGTISARQLVISDPTNWVPDGNLIDEKAAWLGSGMKLVSPNTLTDPEIKGIGQLEWTSGVYHSSDSFAIEAGADYYASWQVKAEGAGQIRMWINIRYFDKTGAYISQDAVYTDPDFITDASLYNAGGVVSAPEGAVTAQWRWATNAATDVSKYYLFNPTLRKQIDGATLITPNSIYTEQLAAQSVDTMHLMAEAVHAQNMTIDGLLKVTDSGAVSAVKTSPSDPSDGLFFGQMGGGSGGYNFAFSASRTEGSYLQEVRLSDEAFRITNADYFVMFETAEPEQVIATTSHTVDLTAPTTSVNLSAVLGGGAGGGSSQLAGADGGDTVVKLMDGSTTVRTFTSQGGKGVAGRSGYERGSAGENSVLGTGGPRRSFRNQQGNEATGYGAGGGGASGGNSYPASSQGSLGGKAAKLVSSDWIDISGMANPKLVITIGARGEGQAAIEPRQRGGHGSPGVVKYETREAKLAPASVIPLAAMESGTLLNTGPFPDYGAGLWVLTTVGSQQNIGISGLRADPNGQIHSPLYGGSFTFVSSMTPVVTDTNSARQLYFQFYKMGP